MTDDLGPGYVRAHNKKGNPVVIHVRDLTADYTLDSPAEADRIAATEPPTVLDASVRAHEAAAVLADNERAALAKYAADERAKQEAASIARRDAAAQAAVDQKDIDAATAEAAVRVTEQKAAAKKVAK